MWKKESEASKKQWEVIKCAIRDQNFSDTVRLWEMATYLPIKAGTLTKENQARLASKGWRVFVIACNNYVIVPSIICFNSINKNFSLKEKEEESKMQWEKIAAVLEKINYDEAPIWTLGTYLPIEAGSLTVKNHTRLINSGWEILKTPAEDYIVIPAVLGDFESHEDVRWFIL